MKRHRLEQEDIEKVAQSDLPWESLSGKTLLISGGTGFLGQFLIDVIRFRNARFGSGIRVVSLSRHPLPGDEWVTYVQADIAEQAEYPFSADFVLHLASHTHPKEFSSDPVGTVITNIFGCQNLLQFAVKSRAKRFLLASSGEIYGDGTGAPLTERDFGYIDCNTARAGYNEAKRACESLCQSYRVQYGLDCVIVRLSRCFGADRKDDSKAISQFMKNALNGEDIVLRSQGKQRFSFCYVSDAVLGILKVLLEGKDGEAYNISSDDEGKTLGDYAGMIAGFAEKKVVYDLDESRNQGVSVANFAVLDCEKLKKLGWRPTYSVSEGFRRTFSVLNDLKNEKI